MSVSGTAVPGSPAVVPRPRGTRPAFLRAPFSGTTWRETIHLILNLPVSIPAFVWVVVITALGVGLTPLFLAGLPLLAAGVWSCRGWGALERGRAEGLLDERVPAPAPLRPARPGPIARIRAGLGDGAGWRAALYMFLLLPWGVLTFSITVSLWAATALTIAYPAFQPLYRAADMPGALLSGDGPKAPGADVYVSGPLWVTGTVAAGVVLLFVTPQVVRALAAVDRVMVRALLGRAFLSEQVRDLQESRGAAVDTAAADLRRIERDLHDGAQARLVALAMELGLAKEHMASGDDPERASAMVAAAHEEVKLALQELRDLARGIHPAVLTDRGLDPALSAVAARCPVPVEVRVDLPRRPAPPIESVAYFCVAELLTNVAKHARASSASVSVTADGDRLIARVSDDGRGGARPEDGSGLRGLAERVRAVDGTLRVSSPEGGPTTVTVTLPFRERV